MGHQFIPTCVGAQTITTIMHHVQFGIDGDRTPNCQVKGRGRGEASVFRFFSFAAVLLTAAVSVAAGAAGAAGAAARC